MSTMASSIHRADRTNKPTRGSWWLISSPEGTHSASSRSTKDSGDGTEGDDGAYAIFIRDTATITTETITMPFDQRTTDVIDRCIQWEAGLTEACACTLELSLGRGSG